MKALIINDTRNDNHLGCIIVMQRLIAECKGAGIEITAMLRLGRSFETRVREELMRCDMVIINGEGTMHHDAVGALAIVRAGLYAAGKGLPVALINTVWQENFRANELLPHCRWISARESMSRDAIIAAGGAAVVVPDLTLSSDPEEMYADVLSDKGVVVMDDVRVEMSLLLARYARTRKLAYFPMGARSSFRSWKGFSKWVRLGLVSGWAPQFHAAQVNNLRQASLVVSGRFHGICLAILAKRPFVAFASNTHKIEGLLHDAKFAGGGRLFPDPPPGEDACAYIDQAVAEVGKYMELSANRSAYEDACEAYLRHARQSVQTMFREIALMGANVSC